MPQGDRPALFDRVVAWLGCATAVFIGLEAFPAFFVTLLAGELTPMPCLAFGLASAGATSLFNGAIRVRRAEFDGFRPVALGSFAILVALSLLGGRWFFNFLRVSSLPEFLATLIMLACAAARLSGWEPRAR